MTILKGDRVKIKEGSFVGCMGIVEKVKEPKKSNTHIQRPRQMFLNMYLYGKHWISEDVLVSCEEEPGKEEQQ